MGQEALVNQTGAAQLGDEFASEYLFKTALVVIEEVLGRIVDTAHIDDHGAGSQECRVTRSKHG
jgi:hypothetical protein